MPAGDPALPVVVVGAGPVGMAVALGLAQRGISVTVLEAATQVSFGSRAICVSRHSMEVADRLGFGERLDLAVEWVGGRSFRDQGDALPDAQGHRHGRPVNVSQSELEQVMVDTVAAHPLVTLHWGAQVTGVAVHGRGDRRGRHDRRRAHAAGRLGRGRGRRPQPGARGAGPAAPGPQLRGPLRHRRHPLGVRPPRRADGVVRPAEQPRFDGDHARRATSGASTTSSTRRGRRGGDPGTDPRPDRQPPGLARRRPPMDLEWHGFYKARPGAGPSSTIAWSSPATPRTWCRSSVCGLNSGMEDAETLAWMLAAVVNGAAGRRLETYSTSGTAPGSRTSPTPGSPRS